MLGTPASISIADSTARASHAGRPYSDSHAASATPTGAAIAIPIAVTIRVPIDRVEEAARLALVQRRRGRFDEQARAQVGDALDEHEDDDRGGDHEHSPMPVAQHSQ